MEIYRIINTYITGPMYESTVPNHHQIKVNIDSFRAFSKLISFVHMYQSSFLINIAVVFLSV